jgi:predicted nucleic acid-binding protein
MSGILLDTDFPTDHIRGLLAPDEPDAAISVVTRAELFAGHEREELAVETLLGRLSEIDVTPDIARRAGRIRRSTGLDIPDAIIAATALKLDLTVMTRNRRHFERVSGLALRVPGEQDGAPSQTEPTTS